MQKECEDASESLFEGPVVPLYEFPDRHRIGKTVIIIRHNKPKEKMQKKTLPKLLSMLLLSHQWYLILFKKKKNERKTKTFFP